MNNQATPSGVLDHHRALCQKRGVIGRWREERDDRLHDLMDLWCDHFDAGLGEATLYAVTSDMTTLAIAAGETMPLQSLLLTDLPSSTGLCVWADPVDELEGYPIVAVSWVTRHDVETYDVETLETFDDDQVDVFVYALLKGELIPVGNMTWIVGDTPDPAHDVESFYDAETGWHTLRAAWTLMSQTLTALTPTSPDRAARRRSIRAGYDLRDVVVVTLRRRRSQPDLDADDESVNWSHRWMVEGHWRNQWLPSVGAHRLQWIASYVKGPENLPLVLKRRVIFLKR
jgi:hypothetical protein